MSDETPDRIELGMTAAGREIREVPVEAQAGLPLIEGMAPEGKGMGPTAYAAAAEPAPPPPPPTDSASSARPASGDKP